MEHKYKVRDNARIVSCEGSHGYSVGDIVIIERDDNDEYLPFYTGEYYIGPEHIEPILEVGTLSDLNVKPGDVVEYMGGGDGDRWLYPEIGHECTVRYDGAVFGIWAEYHEGTTAIWRLISRASDTPKTWGEMTDAEKGALLLAAHEGKVIEELSKVDDTWSKHQGDFPLDHYAYRIKPEPKRETVDVYGGNGFGLGYEFNRSLTTDCTHRITFETIYGKPDCDSIKMDEL